MLTPAAAAGCATPSTIKTFSTLRELEEHVVELRVERLHLEAALQALRQEVDVSSSDESSQSGSESGGSSGSESGSENESENESENDIESVSQD